MPTSFVKRATATVADWHRRRTANWRRLPDFIILGGMKCGATALYETLAQHPQILPALRPDVHFFDHNHERGLHWYRRHFPLIPYAYGKKLVSGRPVLTGEASPHYLFHPHVPWRLHAAVPRAKLIVLLRDPVARAFAHYRHNVSQNLEPLTFPEALAREEDRLRDDRARLQRNELHLSADYQHYAYAAGGRYCEQLVAYHALIAKDQLLILRSEEFYAKPGLTIQKVLAFLGLGHELPAAMTLPRIAPEPPVPAAAAERLRTTFEPLNHRLYQYVGEEFGWDRPQTCLAA
jgi:Sulfotransferase domain